MYMVNYVLNYVKMIFSKIILNQDKLIIIIILNKLNKKFNNINKLINKDKLIIKFKNKIMIIINKLNKKYKIKIQNNNYKKFKIIFTFKK